MSIERLRRIAPWSIQKRLSVGAAVAVAVAVVLASSGAYVAVRAKLRGEVDSSLRDRVGQIQELARFVPPGAGSRIPGPLPAGSGEARFGGAQGAVQFIDPSGQARSRGDFLLPVDPAAASIAKGASSAKLEDRDVAGHHLRILTAPLRDAGAIQVARPLDEVD